jgi:hypothetical protein
MGRGLAPVNPVTGPKLPEAYARSANQISPARARVEGVKIVAKGELL